MAKAKHTLPVPLPSAARRGLLLGALVALAAPKAAPAAPASVERVKAAADALTAALADLHGGQWKATVDHVNGFVLILAPSAGCAA